MLRIYGIPSCSSVKKAFAWAKRQGIAYEFVNFREAPLSREALAALLASVGAEKLCNRRGPAWRALSPEAREAASASEEVLLERMLENPMIIKRPVMAFDDGFMSAGVDEALWEQHR